MPESETPEPPQQKPHRTFFGTIRDSLFEQYSAAKPWRDWWGERFPGMKLKKRVVVVVLALILIVVSMYAGYRMERSRSDARNSFLAGQLLERDRVNQGLRDEIRDNKRSSEAEILNLKTDFNEVRRQKDSEVAKLTMERESALQRNTQWESLPANILNLYSNIYANAPTNIQQFGSLMQSFTNSLNDVVSSRPYFEIILNKSKITVGQAVELDHSRSVLLNVMNVSETTAQNVCLSIHSPIEKTNLLSEGWLASPFSLTSLDGNVVQEIPGWNSWSWKADKSLAAQNTHYAATLTVSTNYHGSVLPMIIEAYSDNSKKQMFAIVLKLKQNN